MEHRHLPSMKKLWHRLGRLCKYWCPVLLILWGPALLPESEPSKYSLGNSGWLMARPLPIDFFKMIGDNHCWLGKQCMTHHDPDILWLFRAWSTWMAASLLVNRQQSSSWIPCWECWEMSHHIEQIYAHIYTHSISRCINAWEVHVLICCIWCTFL